MSYKIGQLRRSSLNNYETTYAGTIEYINYYDNLYSQDSNIIVRDSAFKLSMPLQKDTTYYLKFKLTSYNANFKVALCNSEDKTKKMYIKKIYATYGDVCELVFTPNDDIYDIIIIERVRRTANELNSSSYNVDRNSIELKSLINVILNLPAPYLKQIGLQGPPGLLFSLNGEEMRIGKTGIYEVEGINIYQLSFVIRNSSPIPYEDNLDYFILDFYY